MASGLRALSYSFELQIEDDCVDLYFTRVLESLAADAQGTAQFTIVRNIIPGEIYWRLDLDGVERARNDAAAGLATALLSEINGRSAESWPGVVAHAGGVSHAGLGILLPADPESGKSTLTCGLVRAGFSYLTDEGVAFHPGTARIEPYPKPISLDPGSWFLFPELEPERLPGEEDVARTQWQVPPAAIRPDAVGGPCDARFIVFPKYVEGAATEIEPIARAEALVELAKNTFNFSDHSREYLDQLEIVVRACDCYRMTVGDLDEAIALIEQLFADG